MTVAPLGILALLLACKGTADLHAGTDSPSPTTLDQDGDGWTPEQGDCDDTDPTIHPGADEVVDGINQDCDGRIDEDTEVSDDDWDGYTELEGDCDDAEPTTYPGAEDLFLCDGLDQGCTGVDPCDSLDEAHASILHAYPYAMLGGVDMTGDGHPDVVTATGSLLVWEIPEQGGDFNYGAQVATVRSSGHTDYNQLSLLGDTNGDGFIEIVQGNYASDREWVSVLSAPLMGVMDAEDVAVAVLIGDDDSYFGRSLDAGFDASGDGVPDILVGAYREGDSIGSAYLVSGDVRGEVSMEAALARIHGDEEQDYVGYGMKFSGDNNGDGMADVLVGRWGAFGAPTRVSWFAGPITGSMSTADGDIVLEDLTREMQASSFSAPGDIDGDGIDDLTLRTFEYCTSRVHLFTSLPTMGLTDATARVDGDEQYCPAHLSYDAGFGGNVLMTDLNGDGFDDLVFGAVGSLLGGYWRDPRSGMSLLSGAVAIFVGPFSGVRSFWEADRVWVGATGGAELGHDIASAGDFNGDGLQDFWMAAPYTGEPPEDWWGPNTMDGAAYLMLGSADW